MAQAFSTTDKNTYLDVEEASDAPQVTLTIETPEETLTITVDVADLARAILTASPSFALGVGEIAQRAITQYLDHENYTEEP